MESRETRAAKVGEGVAAVCGPCGKIWMPVVVDWETELGDVGWRTPWVVASSPTVPPTDATTPANGATSTASARWALSPAMAAWSCWIWASVAAICCEVAGWTPTAKAAWAEETVADAWLTPDRAAVSWAAWLASACSSAVWAVVRLPWSTWSWRCADAQVEGGSAERQAGRSSL